MTCFYNIRRDREEIKPIDGVIVGMYPVFSDAD
jgi:hypothetical protein